MGRNFKKLNKILFSGDINEIVQKSLFKVNIQGPNKLPIKISILQCMSGLSVPRFNTSENNY